MAGRRGVAPSDHDQRMKVLLAVLSLVLVGVCGFWGARFLVHRNQSQPVAAPAATAAAQPPALTLASAPGPTQLESFSGLAAHDLFAPQASAKASAPVAAATTTAPASPPARTTTAAPASKPEPKPQGLLLPAALLRLNGTRQVVVVGAAFPQSAPIFRLTAVSRGAMWITLVHGAFTGGRPMLRVVFGHPAKLVSSGGAKLSFLLALVRVTASYVPPPPHRAAAATVVTTTTPFATTPAPTTTTTAATTTVP